MAVRMPIEQARRISAKNRGETAAKQSIRSSHEQAFDRQLADAGDALPPHEIEQELIPGRAMRSDYVWREQRVTVEVDGTIASGQGSHQTESGITKDCVKAARLAALGYMTLRITGTMIASGEAIELLMRVFARIDDERARR